MSRKFTLYQVDAFTKEKLSGNPAGVVTNAALLTEDEMQRIAREMNKSETAFILPPEDSSHDVRVRFFTPLHEVPLCGHATIAAHYVRALENKLGNVRVRQKTGAGILPVEIIREADGCKIVMTQGAISFGKRLQGRELETLVAALGITQADLRENYPVQIVSTGNGKVMVCIRDEALLHRLTPDMGILVGLSRAINCNGYYVFTQGAPGSSPLVHGRMFAPVSGVNEDPVTGNANAPLGAYLVHYGLIEHNGSFCSFQALQGEAMKQPGTITVNVKICDNEPEEVSIAGEAVIVFATELELT